MTDITKETIYGHVVAKSNHYAVSSYGDGHLYKDKAIRGYEQNFARQCKIYKDRMISTPFILYIKVFFKSKSSDLDNALKTILDCLQYVRAITDDNLCMQIHAEKGIDHRRPRVVFGLKEISQQLF